MSSKLDQSQIMRDVHDESSSALKVLAVGGVLVQEPFDEQEFDWVPTGQNGEGQTQEARYYLGGNLIATLQFSYNSEHQLIGIVRS